MPHCCGRMLRRIVGTFEDALMPRRCVFCATRTRDEERFICGGCLDDLPWRDSPVSLAEPGLDCVVAPLVYAFPVDAAIRAFKFRRQLYYGPAFAQLLYAVRHELPEDVDAVLPVPLHWRRKWWRGFNQALEISRPLAGHLGLPVIHDVSRCRATPSQSGLSAAARASNLRGAFRVRRVLNFRHILIVDDVFTTGATANQLARTLRQAGVDKVSLAAVARA
jgi:ComF family protein